MIFKQIVTGLSVGALTVSMLSMVSVSAMGGFTSSSDTTDATTVLDSIAECDTDSVSDYYEGEDVSQSATASGTSDDIPDLPDVYSTNYLYTIGNSWMGDAPTDSVEGTVKFTDNTSSGACDLNKWDTGSTRYNGVWAQYLLTSDDISNLSLTFTIEIGENTTWYYLPDCTNDYEVFSALGSFETTPWETVGEQDANEGDYVTAAVGDKFTYTYDSEDIQNAIDAGKVYLNSCGDGTYVIGFNIQVGNLRNALVTGEISGYLYTGGCTEHTYGEWVTTAEPTCTEDGEQTRTCTVCGNIETQTVAAMGHTSSDWIKSGKKRYKECTVCGKKLKTQTYLSACTVSGVKTKYAYTGKTIKPTITVKDSTKKLTKDTDYTVTYSSNKKTGKAKIVIKGKGDYTGTVTKYFYIVPKKVSSVKVSSPKTKQIKVKWKKDTTASGYQIVYAANKGFTSGKKTVNISKNSTVAKTIKSLKKGKTYYIKVRAYKTIDGKKYYGSCSTVKKIKCK